MTQENELGGVWIIVPKVCNSRVVLSLDCHTLIVRGTIKLLRFHWIGVYCHSGSRNWTNGVTNFLQNLVNLQHPFQVLSGDFNDAQKTTRQKLKQRQEPI